MNDPLIRGARPSRANSDGALRAAVCKFMRSTLARVFGNAAPIIPPPAATVTRKNVPKSSENNRRHS